MGAIPTFRQFLAKKWRDCECPTVEQTSVLWQAHDQLVWERVRDLQGNLEPQISTGALNQVLAEEVIADHLGAKWVEQNVVRSETSKQTRTYLGRDDHQLLRALSMHRVQELARRLYQLQSFPWFDSVLDGVRTRTLSGAAFELDVLWVVQIASPHVEARKESSQKGKDYDAHVLMNRHIVPVEIKAKDDVTAWSAKTVIGTIKGAAAQLPKDDIGLLFLRVPTAWVGPALERDFADALGEGLRQTSRIGAVISAIDKPHLITEKAAQVSRHFHYFATPECPEHIWTFCMHLKQLWDSGLTQMAPDPPF